MVWACFAGNLKSKLVFLVGSQDGEKYVQTLEENLLPFSEELPVTWNFMQDGAPCHCSKFPKDWLFDNYISVLEWPAYSPDLNPIENLWIILVRRVYAIQRQFESIQSLTECIIDAWDSISTETLFSLAQSMRKRCVEVVLPKSKNIDY
ncbi:unnamed protein product [Chondrus crispus]|uniref:Tc1-like transposase DDE domain-containing protein n=1 Tax=Chondrus crispus TaxID=2769 RepID=R7QCX3_CHOCR|nr:unnamed protein product [Chondrus crispus]CDF35305.1 unnamed protein product [Chondrus crispus]|eukprot:XP_005715124.1 unnamed protein product [Chondrus crispus]